MEATDEFLRFEETMDFHKTELRRPEMRCRGPLPSSMLWVDQLRKCDGSGDGLGSEAAKETCGKFCWYEGAASCEVWIS
uniref:Uncharacterized protein n=1 Tax=Physcomitrium patens TaxID=3218 RepID=A0A7I4E0Q0_PHYPA|nr:uncharacterized protein LOC112282784 isoform X2 [Physcomitrium patens]|eukprot:XP_024376624.1 uncharacterized protein LOC112282784 isoform X2 [Physcomitrella patens]